MSKNLHRLILSVIAATLTVGCTTAYDAYGRPRPVVEPGAALLGAAAVGVAAYAIADHQHDHHHHGRYERRSYRRPSRYHHHHR